MTSESNSASYSTVRLKGMGLDDEIERENTEIREAIRVVGRLLDSWPNLQLLPAENEAQLNEALKLYRDMNHLSLTGVTCEQVIGHMHSHTVLLYYQAEGDESPIAVTAATFNMRQNTMMLRLLATHPRMTRKGFARTTVHFLKELCRALHKTDILVYTYPASAAFYKAQNFRHTHTQQQLDEERPGAAPGAAAPGGRARLACASRSAGRRCRPRGPWRCDGRDRCHSRW